MWCVRSALCIGAVLFFSSAANAQTTEAPKAAEPNAPAAGAEQLPAVEVVQETPVQKAARAKKKAPAVSPLSTAPTTAATESAGGG